MGEPTQLVEVYDRKYTFLRFADDHRVHVNRNGKPWLVIGAGSNAIAALLNEHVDLAIEVVRLRQLLGAGEGSDAATGEVPEDDDGENEPLLCACECGCTHVVQFDGDRCSMCNEACFGGCDG